MHHLTLHSYYVDRPVDAEDMSHPDGLLWPIHLSELKDIPNGLIIEEIDSGKTFTVGTMSVDEIGIRHTKGGYTNYGIRGWREAQRVR